MIRKLLIVMATGMCLTCPWAITAHAADTVVVVESPPAGAANAHGGTLTRSASAGPTGFLAVYGGMSVLGLTLAAISRQRLSAMRLQVPAGAGLAYGRRARADFWAPSGPERVPTATASARPALRAGPRPWTRARGRRPDRPPVGVGSRSGESAPD